jgi:ADP-heptose:LPS heptosyltransferase
MLNHPYLDEVIEYDKRKFWSAHAGALSVLGRLRTGSYDLAVVPSTVSVSSTSNLIARLSGARVRCGALSLDGAPNSTAWCFNVTVALGWGNAPHLHQAARNLAVVSPLGIATDDLTHRIGLTQSELGEARSELATLRRDHRFVVGFHPGAGKPPNRWSAERFAALANRAAKKYDAGIVVTQGPMDDEPAGEMLKRMTAPFHLVKNRPIRHVAAVIDALDCYVTNDTGVMHLAGATSPRVLALFGPTDPLQWAPVGEKNRYVLGKRGEINSIVLEEVEESLDAIMVEAGAI